MKKLRVLDLFSGIGGFSLGLERAGGFETVAFCEIEDHPRAVLAKHWPAVPCYRDVRELTADTLRRDGIAVDVICGGFPCQDLSFAGRRAGLEGARSGLWEQYARLIGELRPRFVIVENVPGLLSFGMGTVLGDLAALRYNAVWDCIPASAVGAPHRRDRVWIVAHANASPVQRQDEQRSQPNGTDCGHGSPADTDCNSQHAGSVDAEMGGSPQLVADASRVVQHRSRTTRPGRRRQSTNGDGWLAEPDVGRVAHGVPARMDRLKALGNAVVPQIPEIIGRAIMQAEGMTA